jgi:hypothetical protein
MLHTDLLGELSYMKMTKDWLQNMFGILVEEVPQKLQLEDHMKQRQKKNINMHHKEINFDNAVKWLRLVQC